MRLNYTETRWNENAQKVETVAEWSVFCNPDDNGALLIVRNGERKTIKVIHNYEFVYSLQKTRIKANGGAGGLFRFMERCINDNFSTCHVNKILNYAFYEMRALKCGK